MFSRAASSSQAAFWTGVVLLEARRTLQRTSGEGGGSSSQSWVGNSSTRLTRPKPSTMLATARTMRTLPLILCLSVLVGTAFGGEPNVVLENARFRNTISPEGGNVAFVDCATATDYLRATGPSPCALIRVRGQEQAATAATLAQGHLTLQFGTNGLKAVLKTEVRPSFITLSVESVSGGEIDSLTFLNIPLTLKGVPDERFGACAPTMVATCTNSFRRRHDDAENPHQMGPRFHPLIN